MTQAPPASETRKQLETAGIPPEKIDQAVTQYRNQFGAAVKSDDFLVWLVAKKEFGVKVPDISTLSSGGGDQPVRMADIGRKTSEDGYYTTRGYILDTYEYEPDGKNPRRKIVLLDETGVGNVMVWHNNLDKWTNEGYNTGYVELDGLQALHIADGYAVLTYGTYSEASQPADPAVTREECYAGLANADEDHVEEWEYAFVEGVVTDESRHEFETGDGMQKRLGEFHTVSVTAGGAMHTVKIPPNLAPHEDLFGHPVRIVAQWRPETYEKDGTEKTVHTYRAVTLDVEGQEFDTPRNELEAQANADAAKLTDQDPTTDNVFDYIAEHDTDSGVPVRDVIAAFGGNEFAVEEALDELQGAGRVYESEFGVMRIQED